MNQICQDKARLSFVRRPLSVIYCDIQGLATRCNGQPAMDFGHRTTNR